MFVVVSTDSTIIKLDYCTHSRGLGPTNTARSSGFRFTQRQSIFLIMTTSSFIFMDYYLQCYLMTKGRRNRQIFTVFRSESTCLQLAIDRNEERDRII